MFVRVVRLLMEVDLLLSRSESPDFWGRCGEGVGAYSCGVGFGEVVRQDLAWQGLQVLANHTSGS